MTPWERYQADLQRADFTEDPAQGIAVQHTQVLYDALVSLPKHENGLITIIRNSIGSKPKPRPMVKGLYFWGGVGRGKTWIVDSFFDCLPFAEKKRIHFHRFMQMIHQELKQLKNRENPLCLIADKITADTRVLCFDEFHVTDITDAMLLGGLLGALFERGLTLVTTSNEAPDELYRNGLQRDRFLPAIDLIKTYTYVVNVDSGIDYRLRFLDKAEIYHFPLDENAERMLHENFSHIVPNEGINNAVLEIESRPIKTVRCGDGVVWFDFYEICDGPRGPADYIEVARQFQTVLIGGVPVLGEADNDRAKRFMTLVDEFYDRNVKLILTADAAPEQLYNGKCLATAFQRTISRLNEMQTHDYLAKQHLS